MRMAAQDSRKEGALPVGRGAKSGESAGGMARQRASPAFIGLQRFAFKRSGADVPASVVIFERR